MEVKHSKSFPNINNYAIEWGNATWTEKDDEENKERSIRNRYSKADGGYNHTGSKEVSWNDFNRMIIESIIENEFSNNELKAMVKTAFIKLLKNIFKI